MAEALAGRHYEAPTPETQRGRPVQKVLVVVIVVLAVALVAEIIYHAVVAPRLVVTTIEIASDIAWCSGCAALGCGAPGNAAPQCGKSARYHTRTTRDT